MYTLADLPYEVLSYVVGYLTLQDVYCLVRTSKNFEFLFEEERICKFVLQKWALTDQHNQTKLPYSTEAIEAAKVGGGNARNLRRALKRHEALATASPFVVATVGFCDSYLYSKGVLCYTLDEKLRVLNLHHSGRNELVINIPSLLSYVLTGFGGNTNGYFQMLYYSDYILSCSYRSAGSDPTTWLIAFNLVSRHILVAHELESSDKLFVRHNKHYLYYGTHSELGTDGYKKWAISGYSFTDRTWFKERIHLSDLVGSEIGSTICFEIYNGFFYGLSNQTSFEVEEIDWTSFYHCIRFPLNSPCNELLEKTENKSMWRRQHQEGPIDDRWTHLRLVEEETSGSLSIVEARKEWYLGSSKSQRTYYTTDIVFPKPSDDEDQDSQMDHSWISENQTLPIPSWLLSPAITIDESTSSAASATLSDTFSSSSTVIPTNDLRNTTSESSSKLDVPDKQLGKLIAKDDHPNYIKAPNRRPENTHPGHDGSAQPTITLAKCRLRTYNPSCSTFLDLVDDPHPGDWQCKQRLRLRAGTRTLKPILKDQAGLLRQPSEDLRIALHQMYQVPPITMWPKPQDLDSPDDQLDAIYRVMNPPSHTGNVEGTADERSIIYTTGSHNGPKALIFIGFDPSTRLAGLKSWNCASLWGTKGVGEGPHVDGRASGTQSARNDNRPGNAFVDVAEANRTVVIDHKGKGKANLNATTIATAAPRQKSASAQPQAQAGQGWARRETAMYRDINVGFYFGLDKARKA